MIGDPTLYPWCQFGSHDYRVTTDYATVTGPGLCRVHVDGRSPCACPCHNGGTEARDWSPTHRHHDSLRGYLPGPPVIAQAGHKYGWWRDLIGSILPRRYRPAVTEAAKFPVPDQWTWEHLEHQVALKDMQFRYVADYPQKIMGRTRQPDHSNEALDDCLTVWDLLHRIMTRNDSLDTLVKQWESIRHWRLVEAGPPLPGHDSDALIKFHQHLVMHKER